MLLKHTLFSTCYQFLLFYGAHFFRRTIVETKKTSKKLFSVVIHRPAPRNSPCKQAIGFEGKSAFDNGFKHRFFGERAAIGGFVGL